MKKTRDLLVVILLLLLIAISIFYIAGTYAKYTSEISDIQGEAIIAKWDFDVENASQTLDIDLGATYDPDTLVADRIAPGTEGSFAIQLTNANTETGVDYTIAFGTATGVPTNLKFYSDSTYNTELTLASDTLTGTLDAEDATGDTITFYWKWDYETTNGDEADTTNGKAGGANGTKMTLPITITGVQVEPTV